MKILRDIDPEIIVGLMMVIVIVFIFFPHPYNKLDNDFNQLIDTINTHNYKPFNQ